MARVRFAEFNILRSFMCDPSATQALQARVGSFRLVSLLRCRMSAGLGSILRNRFRKASDYSPSQNADVVTIPVVCTGYTEENPKIQTACLHHFHLSE